MTSGTGERRTFSIWDTMRANPTSHQLWLDLTRGGKLSGNITLDQARRELTDIHWMVGCDQKIGKGGHDLS